MSRPETDVPLANALFPLSEAADRFPRRGGRVPSNASIYRAAGPGWRGNVLQTWNIAGRLYTTEEAIAAFIAACTETARGPAPPPRRRRKGKAAATRPESLKTLRAAGLTDDAGASESRR